jgi:hypothetical protein
VPVDRIACFPHAARLNLKRRRFCRPEVTIRKPRDADAIDAAAALM